MQKLQRIDSHQHFWRLTRGDYDWLTPQLEPINRDFLPPELQPILVEASVSKTILVQAAASIAETEFILSIAEANAFVVGVVGWVDMEHPTVLSTLQRLSENCLFLGVRPMIQDINDPDWMLKPELKPVYDWLSIKGLSFDALVNPQHLKNLLVLSHRYPNLKIVIDHGGKPNIANSEFDEWAEDMAALAESTQVVCKLSGLLTEAAHDATYKDLLPYMEHLLRHFGADRLMWGSDWPVVNLAADYHRWVGYVEQFVNHLSASKQAAIWHGTASRFYGVVC